MVGTLAPEKKPKSDKEAEKRLLTNYTFNKMILEDPDLQLRYSAGIEVMMSTADFTNAEIDILELRAMPTEEAATAMRN